MRVACTCKKRVITESKFVIIFRMIFIEREAKFLRAFIQSNNRNFSSRVAATDSFRLFLGPR